MTCAGRRKTSLVRTARNTIRECLPFLRGYIDLAQGGQERPDARTGAGLEQFAFPGPRRKWPTLPPERVGQSHPGERRGGAGALLLCVTASAMPESDPMPPATLELPTAATSGRSPRCEGPWPTFKGCAEPPRPCLRKNLKHVGVFPIYSSSPCCNALLADTRGSCFAP